MSLTLNKAAYEKLIAEDIAALRASNCEMLERDHIIHVLSHSVELYYPKIQSRPEDLESEFQKAYRREASR